MYTRYSTLQDHFHFWLEHVKTLKKNHVPNNFITGKKRLVSFEK